VQSNTDDQGNDPVSFIQIMGKVFACGRDSCFPAWPDMLQPNAFETKLRFAVIGRSQTS